ncbi:hypothetical protein B0J13DRAFT_448056 [Dactylonectria estremocensis]|uniref:Uncharacterized protein n=1 Tax=Dactylonectria estremocensis TaxID=1079267 RepID=A0A9P9IY04_9HYPO|nr:hypothetical protein B0J13DRAFT_448056 [Dactylonectria estremocensis]
MHFPTFFRKLRHKPRQRYTDLDNNEPLMGVCSKSRSSALWHSILFHFPAVVVTTTLLALYARNIHLGQSHPTAEELSALQFAAKAHESLILISLTDILLQRIHYGLLCKNGVPLGFLSSPFNIGFSLRYLVSREFWSAMLSPTSNGGFHSATAALVLVFALVSLAAGPSSAIAMIPRYGWWQLSMSPYHRPLIEGDPYNIEFDSQHGLGYEACGLVNNETCVNQNLSTTMQILETLSPDANSRGQLAYAITPMEFVQDALAADAFLYYEPQTLIRSEALKPHGKEKWKQPLVAVHCVETRWLPTLDDTSATFGFGDTLYDDFTVSLGFNDTLEFLRNIPIDVASMLFTYSFLDVDYSSSNMEDRVPWIDINLCLVQARWVEAEVWLHPKESLDIQSHLDFPLSDAMQYMREQSDNEKPIKMTVEWLRDIGVPPSSGSIPQQNPAYRQGLDFCGGNKDFYTPSCVPSFLAVYLANALSRNPDIKVDSSLTSPSPGPNSTVIYNTYLEHVYAYGFRESTTIRLAFTALFLQVFIALIHLALTVFSRQSWSCCAWGTIGQLLTLALQSRAPDELSNVGAGGQNSHTWRLMTVLKEVGGEKQLEIVGGARTGTSRPGQVNTDV